MNDTFANQKEKLLAIKQEISLLHQQVNYLLRNEKALELLDLDVLMNRTHTLYDMLCSINVGDGFEDEDLPFDAEALSGLFGGMAQEDAEPEPEEEPETDEGELVAEDRPSEPIVETLEEEKKEDTSEDTIVMPPVDLEIVQPAKEEPVEQEKPIDTIVEEEPEQVLDNDQIETEEKPIGDNFDVFFRFENVSDERPEEKEPKNETIESASKVVHVMEAIPEEEIPERDRVHGEDLVKDNPLEMPKMEDDRTVYNELENERQGSGQVSGFFEPDDAGFELSLAETLGEKMMGEDHSLAARLQQNPVRDLKSVIGINDKFLFVNELFGGSMEKYNKSIENLNDLKTLNGAMIYLNELKIELAWNSSNEAYQKLKDLVARKFE